jgi:hypothetical protein
LAEVAEATLAVTAVGAPGIVAGVTALLLADADPVPKALVAVTEKVYEVPLVSPVTMQAVAAVVQVRPPGLDVTV